MSEPILTEEDLGAVTVAPGLLNDTLGAGNAAGSVGGTAAGLAGVAGGAGTLIQGLEGLRTARTPTRRNDAILQTANGGLSAASGGVGIAAEAQAARQAQRLATSGAPVPGSVLPTVARGLSAAAGVAEFAQGSGNVALSIQDWNRRDTTQQMSDGLGNMLHGGLSSAGAMMGSPLLAAGALGVAIGTPLVNATDAHARANGTYGADSRARGATRGVNDAAVANASGSENAADTGARVFQSVSTSASRGLRGLGASGRTADRLGNAAGHMAGLPVAGMAAVANTAETLTQAAGVRPGGPSELAAAADNPAQVQLGADLQHAAPGTTMLSGEAAAHFRDALAEARGHAGTPGASQAMVLPRSAPGPESDDAAIRDLGRGLREMRP